MLCAVVLLRGQTPLYAESRPDALKMLREIDDLWRGDSSFAKVTMKVKTRHYTRTMRMEVWSKGTEKTLVRITAPLKEKGMSTLKSGNHIFTYLPRTDRTIRLTSGMMMGSWMGSHFTNDDLVKESRREEDYEVCLTFEGKRKGVSLLEFTLIPKADAAVVWGKVVLTVRADDVIPLKEVFFDEDMVIARTFSFERLKEMSGRLRPSIMRVVPADKPDEYTEVIYESLKLNIDIDNDFFSMAGLRRR